MYVRDVEERVADRRQSQTGKKCGAGGRTGDEKKRREQREKRRTDSRCGGVVVRERWCGIARGLHEGRSGSVVVKREAVEVVRHRHGARTPESSSTTSTTERRG